MIKDRGNLEIKQNQKAIGKQNKEGLPKSNLRTQKYFSEEMFSKLRPE